MMEAIKNNQVRFGITERGDIAFDDDWIPAVKNGDVAAAILISKGIPTPTGKEAMLEMKDKLIFMPRRPDSGVPSSNLASYPSKNVLKPWQASAAGVFQKATSLFGLTR